MGTFIGVINFIAIASDLLQARFGFDEVSAGFYFTLPYLVAAICSPIMGVFITYVGYRMTINIMGALFMLTSFIMLLIVPDCDNECWYSSVPYVLLGISYSSYAVVSWGAIPYMVEARTLGTAFGIATCFSNLGTTISPTIIGLILDNSSGEGKEKYQYVTIFFAAVSLGTLLCNIMIYRWDRDRRNNLLQHVDALEEFERYTTSKMTVDQRIDRDQRRTDRYSSII